MVERKLFKTKLCVLYKRGRCTRQSCSFAHGDAELRRFSGSSHGRQDFGEGDLRDKLDRRHSPRRMSSPMRDARGRNTFRESSPSRSLEKESDIKHRKRQRLDGQTDAPGRLRISASAENQSKEGKLAVDSRIVLMEQLNQVQLDINRLDHQKSELQVKLEERVQEVDSLTSKIQELEAQLYKEKEENQRILSKINKFVKAHNRRLEIQDELRRSEVKLRKLGDELCSDIEKVGANEEDLSINIVSDGEAVGFPVNAHNEKQNDIYQNRKSQDVSRGHRESLQAMPYGDFDNLIPVDSAKAHVEAPVRSKKVSRWNIPAQPKYDNDTEVAMNRNGRPNLRTNERKHETRTTDNVSSANKSKSSDTRLMWPPTSMAAHAVDEDVEIELEDTIPVTATASRRVVRGATHDAKGFALPLPPLPPLLKNNYSQYEGNDEDIDVSGVGVEEEMLELHNF